MADLGDAVGVAWVNHLRLPLVRDTRGIRKLAKLPILELNAVPPGMCLAIAAGLRISSRRGNNGHDGESAFIFVCENLSRGGSVTRPTILMKVTIAEKEFRTEET
jgi:hypothetical protein